MVFQKFHSAALGLFSAASLWLPFLVFSVLVEVLNDQFNSQRLIQCGMGCASRHGMGFLDHFKKKPKAGPLAGTIESYRVVDNVGEVRLASGNAFRFGRTACKGLEPAVGVKVHVESVGPHPLGGERVQSMVHDPSDTAYEQQVATRDGQAAPPRSSRH